MSASSQRRSRNERGSVTIQMAFLMPALFLLMFVGLQGALYYHAKQVALAAAQEGAREASSETGTRESGVVTANTFLNHAGGSDVMTSTSVSGSRTTTTATVTVTGQSLSVIPGWQVTVTQSASLPVERLTQ